MKREKKPSPSDEPSSRDKLSHSFVNALEKDWAEHGSVVIEAIRRESPTKYGELIARLVPMDLSPPASPYARAKSVRDMGRVLLQQVGLDEWFITDGLIDQALAAEEKFIAELQSIATKAEH
jgi:hypothetical protein